jgi:hypothetical protein
VARIGGAVGAGIVALILFGTTLWFLGDALMLWLQDKGYGAAGAAGLTGLAGLVLTALLGLLAKWLVSPRRRPALPATAAPRGNGVTNGIAADLGALAAQQIVSTTRAHPYSTMGAALAAGIAVGAVPELRKAAFNLFKH